MRSIRFLKAVIKTGKRFHFLYWLFYNGKKARQIPIELTGRTGKQYIYWLTVSNIIQPIKHARNARFTRVRDAIVFKLYCIRGRL